MDEILIEDKKYVSSKRAAKLTGYAKDYIGQLCREGRVPARLVGRSWYVLESAIQDHRFGNPEVTREKPVQSSSHSTWEAPRYEASEADIFPSINRLRSTKTSAVPDVSESSEKKIDELPPQDAWQAWFNRFDHINDVPPTIPTERIEEEPAHMYQQEESKGERVPIRAIHHSPYQPPAEELPSLQKRGIEGREESEEEEIDRDTDLSERIPREEERRIGKTTIRAIQMSGILVAAIMAIAATLGSGNFDKYIISNSQVSIFAGVVLYNR